MFAYKLNFNENGANWEENIWVNYVLANMHIEKVKKSLKC